MALTLAIRLIIFIFITVLQEKNHFQIRAAKPINENDPSPNISCNNAPECITLIKDASGISLPVNFVLKNNNKPNFLTKNQKDTTEVAKMLIDLRTSMTLLVSNCQAFSPYDCQRYSCEEHPNDPAISLHPYFIAKGYFIEANISLDDSNWKLKEKTILSTSCFAGILDTYGAGTFGAIGFGVAGPSWQNYMRLDPIFSVYLYRNDSGGELWFSRNFNKTTSATPSAVLVANNSWHVENVQSIEVGGKITPLNATNIIFDLNMAEIALPLNIYKYVIRNLTRLEVPFRCGDYKKNFYRLSCTYNGELKNLPNITINVGDQKIIIPSSVYVFQPETYDTAKGTLTLNLKAIYDVTHLPENHVITEYKNYIILGRSFMRYYYIVFDGANHQQNNTRIELYMASSDIFDDNSNSGNPRLIIIILVAIFCSVVGIRFIYLRWRKYRKVSARLPEDRQQQQPVIQHSNQEDILSLTDQLIPEIENNGDQAGHNQPNYNDSVNNNESRLFQPVLPLYREGVSNEIGR